MTRLHLSSRRCIYEHPPHPAVQLMAYMNWKTSASNKNLASRVSISYPRLATPIRLPVVFLNNTRPSLQPQTCVSTTQMLSLAAGRYITCKSAPSCKIFHAKKRCTVIQLSRNSRRSIPIHVRVCLYNPILEPLNPAYR
jgi:hypothetical protein